MGTSKYLATIVLKDEQGNSISESNYEIPVDSFSIDKVENAVTEFKKHALPQMEHDLLANEQVKACKKKRRLHEKR
jgi:hypothetical protein